MAPNRLYTGQKHPYSVKGRLYTGQKHPYSVKGRLYTGQKHPYSVKGVFSKIVFRYMGPAHIYRGFLVKMEVFLRVFGTQFLPQQKKHIKRVSEKPL